MSGFKFRYERLLQLRTDEENEKKQILAEKISNMTRLKEKLKQLREDKEKNDKFFLDLLSTGIGAGDLRLMNDSKRWYRMEIKRFLELLSLSEENVKNARQELMNATQELKKMEKLKEKALEEHNEIEEKNFGEMIDGVINYQAVIKR